MQYERWLPVPSERDRLIEEVRHGRLTPDQAELEVSRLGLEPLQFTPNPNEFDPMKEPTWSLLMTLAWIMWRSTDVVREMRDDYRKACRDWVPKSWQVPGGPINTGHWLESKSRAELMDLDIAAAVGRPTVVKNSSEAFHLLKNEAQRAEWKATGIPQDGSRRREILPIEWVDFRIERVRGAGVRLGQDLGYDECRFPVDGVTKSFPACRSAELHGPRRAKGGRPRRIQYDLLKAEFVRLMAKHGDISADDPEWNSKEKVIAALEQFYREKRKAEVSRRSLQPKVNEWLQERRQSAATN